jgi:Tol biopolymer transport system component
VGTFIDFFTGLWEVNVDGSGERQLSDLFDAWDPAWSLDGSQIAFATNAGIEVAQADGSGRRLLVPGAAREPDWTPDGRVVFVRPTSPDHGPRASTALDLLRPSRRTSGMSFRDVRLLPRPAAVP